MDIHREQSSLSVLPLKPHTSGPNMGMPKRLMLSACGMLKAML